MAIASPPPSNSPTHHSSNPTSHQPTDHQLTDHQPTHYQPTDQLITLQGAWAHFKLIQQGFEQNPGVRLFYYDERIEILMPGQPHEIFASMIGCLLMMFLANRRIVFVPTRSMTQEREGVASAQADESYCLGQAKPIPDLAIEVVFTSGGISKLTRYQALGVPEVWFWEDGTSALYHLRTEGYERIQQSEPEGLKELDLELLKRCILIGETDAGEAVRVFPEGITKASSSRSLGPNISIPTFTDNLK
jgi:Uma2 family endonuclease